MTNKLINYLLLFCFGQSLFGADITLSSDISTDTTLSADNDYILEKAFVYGIVALSKWLGEERYPCGVYGQWPPPFPAGLAPRSEGRL